MSKEILTLSELCEKLRICKAEFYRLKKTNCVPPHFKLGSRSYFKNSTVDAWLEAKENV